MFAWNFRTLIILLGGEGERKLLRMVRFWWVFQNPAKLKLEGGRWAGSKQWWRVWNCLQFSSFRASKLSISQISYLTSLILSDHLYYRLLLLLVTKAGKQGELMNSRRGKVKEFKSCWETVRKKFLSLFSVISSSVFLYLTGLCRILFRLKEDVHVWLWSLMNDSISI